MAADESNNFAPGMSQPALNALEHAGYKRLEDLTSVTAAEVLALHGMGPKGIRILREALAAKGLDFAAPKPKTSKK